MIPEPCSLRIDVTFEILLADMNGNIFLYFNFKVHNNYSDLRNNAHVYKTLIHNYEQNIMIRGTLSLILISYFIIVGSVK